ncbi:GNAT family N-acetyltransferase [Paenibacillus sp. NPDC058177]|uniref:GNAT family N-acetyltransferase n=1 Tax=Paenibacillus sp. NPDC058177 TaxID=3346369 RepID=UPI0036D8118B
MDQRDTILKYLREQPLKNITLLKMVTYFSHVMNCHYVECPEGRGVLLLLPAEAYAYDHRTYPEAELIVFMEYSSPAVFPHLLALVPKDAKLVFKLQDEAYYAVLSKHFSLTKARGYITYTTPANLHMLPAQETVQLELLDNRLLPLWEGNHYSLEEIQEYFRSGAFSVSIFEGETPLSTCLAFRNEDQVWEIGAVYTVESARGKGLAKKVVQTALFYLHRDGRIPRYHVLETNHTSIRLAESLGLVPCITLVHWTN